MTAGGSPGGGQSPQAPLGKQERGEGRAAPREVRSSLGRGRGRAGAAAAALLVGVTIVILVALYGIILPAMVVARGASWPLSIIPDEPWIILPASEGPDLGATVERVADGPDELEGRAVTVSGEIGEFVVPERVFTLGEGFSDTVLVVPATRTRVPQLGEDDVVQVRGPVYARFDLAEVLGRTDVVLQREAFEPFQGRPVMVAIAITEIPTDEDED